MMSYDLPKPKRSARRFEKQTSDREYATFSQTARYAARSAWSRLGKKSSVERWRHVSAVCTVLLIVYWIAAVFHAASQVGGGTEVRWLFEVSPPFVNSALMTVALLNLFSLFALVFIYIRKSYVRYATRVQMTIGRDGGSDEF